MRFLIPTQNLITDSKYYYTTSSTYAETSSMSSAKSCDYDVQSYYYMRSTLRFGHDTTTVNMSDYAGSVIGIFISTDDMFNTGSQVTIGKNSTNITGSYTSLTPNAAYGDITLNAGLIIASNEQDIRRKCGYAVWGYTAAQYNNYQISDQLQLAPYRINYCVPVVEINLDTISHKEDPKTTETISRDSEGIITIGTRGNIQIAGIKSLGRTLSKTCIWVYLNDTEKDAIVNLWKVSAKGMPVIYIDDIGDTLTWCLVKAGDITITEIIAGAYNVQFEIKGDYII